MLEPVAPDSHAAEAFAGTIVSLLHELDGLLQRVDAKTYNRRGSDGLSGATLGGHVRHVLDHLAALPAGLRVGRVEYDLRARGTPVETDPGAARARVADLLPEYLGLRQAPGDEAITVALVADPRSGPLNLRSSLARELAFVLSHTVHHQAVIRALAAEVGLSLESAFGVAPATLRHRAHQDTPPACAR